MTDRKTILWGITDAEEKLFLSHMCDKCDKSERSQRVVYTKFITPRQALLAKERLGGIYDIRFFGGFDGAERTVAAIVPNEWEELQYPVCAIRIDNLGKRELTHRDYLGSILGLGITRDNAGDIVIGVDSAIVMVYSDIADYIVTNLTKVGSCGVRIGITEDVSSLEITKSFKNLSATVSSMRLDCVIAAIINKSRSVSADIISEGIVNVNYEAVKNVSYTVKDGDIISVRGYGKAIVETDLNLTKKGRIHINIRKYI